MEMEKSYFQYKSKESFRRRDAVIQFRDDCGSTVNTSSLTRNTIKFLMTVNH